MLILLSEFNEPQEVVTSRRSGVLGFLWWSGYDLVLFWQFVSCPVLLSFIIIINNNNIDNKCKIIMHAVQYSIDSGICLRQRIHYNHIIFYIVINLITVPNQNKVDPRTVKNVSSKQCAYNKHLTHACVLSPTLAHGNNNNEIRQINKERRQAERGEYENK